MISEARARQLAEKYNLVYIETSAATGHNVRKAVDILLDKVMARYRRNLSFIYFWFYNKRKKKIIVIECRML